MEVDVPSTPSSAGPAAGILRPPSADLALETTPEDDPMVEHMHLHVSPSRGEVHAHGRWHKYVKPRIGPGFQVKADAIPEVGDGLMGEGERGDGQQQQQQRGMGGGGSSMSRDSSAADLSSAAEEQGSTGRQQRRSGRSSAGSRRGSRSSSGRSTPTSSSNGNEPDEQREFFSFIFFFIQSIKYICTADMAFIWYKRGVEIHWQRYWMDMEHIITIGEDTDFVRALIFVLR